MANHVINFESDLFCKLWLIQLVVQLGVGSFAALRMTVLVLLAEVHIWGLTLRVLASN